MRGFLHLNYNLQRWPSNLISPPHPKQCGRSKKKQRTKPYDMNIILGEGEGKAWEDSSFSTQPIAKFFLSSVRNILFNNYSSSPNGLWVNSPWGRRGYWFRGYESERNNCFSKIQLVGQKNMETKYLSQVKARHQPFFTAKILQKWRAHFASSGL